PALVVRLMSGAPAVKALTYAKLKFYGVRPVRKLLLSPVTHSTDVKKQQRLMMAYEKGRCLHQRVLTPWVQTMRNIAPWIQAIRFQFYPMTFFAYGIGALAFLKLHGGFDLTVFLLGYVLLFLMEVIVVFSNDYYDRETDRLNRFFSPFSGGSRV